MCLIIDTCTFNAVFNEQSKHHHKYAAVLDWVNRRRGKIIIGGTKYRNELKTEKILSILAEYQRKTKVVAIPDIYVDREAKRLKGVIGDKDFNDEHLVALVVVSGCRVLCTNDKRALPYIKCRALYPKGIRRPLIYQSERNAKLCSQDNIVEACEEHTR
jgi:predicted nucleic acid-binding protein